MGAQITLLDILGVDPNISIVLNGNKLKEIHNLIEIKFGSVKTFSKIIGFSQNTIYLWLRNKRTTKLKTLMKMCGLLDIKIEETVEKVISMKKPKIGYISISSFPIKKDANLASLVGHSFGDGHIGDNFEYTNKCEELLNEVNHSVKQLPIKKVKIINNFQPNKAPTLVFPKVVRNILVCAGAPIGNKITNCYKLPEWIKMGNKEIKRAFIRALFDDEGNISKTSIIRFSMSKRMDLIENLYVFFKDVELILNSLGIQNITIKKEGKWDGKNGKTTSLVFQIFGYYNFKEFFENIKLNSPRKIESLRRLAIKPKHFRLRKGETKRNIINLIQNDFLNIDEIANHIGFDWKTIWEHLSELESKNLVIRTKPDSSRKYLWHKNDDYNIL